MAAREWISVAKSEPAQYQRVVLFVRTKVRGHGRLVVGYRREWQGQLEWAKVPATQQADVLFWCPIPNAPKTWRHGRL